MAHDPNTALIVAQIEERDRLRAEVGRLTKDLHACAWPQPCTGCGVPVGDAQCGACAHGPTERQLKADLERIRADRDRIAKLLPRCLGEWTKGSGGHRMYAGGCAAPGVWDVGLGFVCDEHKSKTGGDDDAWHWDEEADQLRTEVDRLRTALSDVLPWLRPFGASEETKGGYESALTPMYMRRGSVRREDVIARVEALLALKEIDYAPK